MSRTALVHPATAKLTPEEQRTGTYEYTSPEDYAVRNAQAVVDTSHIEAALAAPLIKTLEYGGTVTGGPISGGPALQTIPKRIIRKPAPTFNDPLQALRDVANIAATSLPDGEAYNLLVQLANRFGMEIE